MQPFNLTSYGITVKTIRRNLTPAQLYKGALQREKDNVLTENGAIVAYSGEKTGRSPQDKRVVKEASTERNIWWGGVNVPLTPSSFDKNLQLALDYLNAQPQIFVFDGFAGWSKEHQVKIRIICSLPYHALFMHNMLIRPSLEELQHFGAPDYVIYNAGSQPASTAVEGVSGKTSVALSFQKKQFVILGTNYAGEMKKGVFTIMNYLMPEKNLLSMHCSANEGERGDVSLFFGLSGTGKTTLSADPKRYLIGDDEHVWDDKGIFNIEGGCYAKCINLSYEKEPEIFEAIRFGTVLENAVVEPHTAKVKYEDDSITENTRAAYPLEHIEKVKIPALGERPRNIIFLTCDAFGVLPPVSHLTPSAASYHFLSGYTAKVAGTEMGITEPEASFSACFGAPFLVWHPSKYAHLLAEKMARFKVDAWLINTGWCGGPYGVGSRISLKNTRAIIDAIHSGALAKQETKLHPYFQLAMPKTCPGVPAALLDPQGSWKLVGEYRRQAEKLVNLFQKNFKTFEAEVAPEILAAGPIIP